MPTTSTRLLVLGWHSIEPSWCFPTNRRISLAGFAAQIALLRRVATVLPLDDALARLTAGVPLPPRAVALTFDDGYADTVSVVAPLLARHRLPATFFVCPGLLDRSVEPWWEVASWAVRSARAKELNWGGQHLSLRSAANRRSVTGLVLQAVKDIDHVRRDAALADLVEQCQPAGRLDAERLFLDWAGAGRLVDNGFTVSSHSLSHWILSRETEAAQKEEIVGARDALSSKLGVETDTFCYPNGRECDFTGSTMDIVANAGHRFAVTTIFGRNDAAVPAHAIRRVMVDSSRGPAAFLPALLARSSAGRHHLGATLAADQHDGC